MKNAHPRTSSFRGANAEESAVISGFLNQAARVSAQAPYPELRHHGNAIRAGKVPMGRHIFFFYLYGSARLPKQN